MLLPTPGSPASRIAAPGHQAAAEHPVELGHPAGAERRTRSTDDLADRHRRAWSPGRRRPAASGAAASATEPQAWHSPQRPTHLRGLPAALGAAVGGTGAAVFDMAVTLGEAADSSAPPRGRRRTTRAGAAPYGSLMLTSPAWIDQARWRVADGVPMTSRCPSRRRPWPTSPSARASRGRPSPTPSTTPTCCAPTPWPACRRRSRSSATRPTAPPATCAPAPRHLIGLKFSPAQEGTANAAMDRFVHSLVETAGERRLPRPAVRRSTRRGPARRVRRPAALHRRRRVHRDRHLPRQPAGGLADGSGGRRSWRSAARGTTPTADHPWVDVDGAAGVELATDHLLDRGHDADRLDRLAQGLPHRRGPPFGLDPRHARAATSRPPAWPRASRTPSPSGREAAAVLLDEAQPIGVRVRLRHPGHGRAAHPRATAACAPGQDIAVVGFDDSQVAQVVRPGLTSVRQPLEEVAVEMVRALEGLLGHAARRRAPACCSRPTLGRAPVAAQRLTPSEVACDQRLTA